MRRKTRIFFLSFCLILGGVCLGEETRDTFLRPLVHSEKLEGNFHRTFAREPGPNILLLNGGRPSASNYVGKNFVNAGSNTILLNSVYLDGNGGASIRQFPTDKEEPLPIDGITPEFDRLHAYALVIFNGIPADCQKKIMTDRRTKQLRSYVENGGALFWTRNAPFLLKDLLPVTGTGKERLPAAGATVQRPQEKAFGFLPENWILMDSYRECIPAKNARVLSWILGKSGCRLAPYLVEMPLGKGRILYLNDELSRGKGVVQLYTWAYGRALMIAASNHIAGLSLNPDAVMEKEDPLPPQTILPAQKIKVSQPEMLLRSEATPPQIQGDSAIFPNGIILRADSNSGKVSVMLPGESVPYLTYCAPPEIILSKTQKVFDSHTAEAVDVKEEFSREKIRWKLTGLENEESGVFLKYSGETGEILHWHFKSGTLLLDGRLYEGIAQKIELRKAHPLISMLQGKFLLNPPALYARRMSCYQAPRGYYQPDLSGTVDADTKLTSFFGNSQPFGYVAMQNGIYTEFIETPQPTVIRFAIRKGEKAVTGDYQFHVGRHYAPVSSTWFWQMYSRQPERGVNDYLAVWQFCRSHLRRVAHLRELPARPCAQHLNTCSREEVEQSIRLAGKMGFQLYHLPFCPTAIEALEEPERRELYREIRRNGMQVSVWSPCDYSHGTSERIYSEHPEWYIKDEKGKNLRYFGQYPVLNPNHPEFRKWYWGLMERILPDGLGTIYMDMGGSAAHNIDFAKRECDPGLTGLLETYRFFQDRGVAVSVEGMNPLVLDTYWYHAPRYSSFAGKEFAMLGAQVGNNQGDDFILDFFRVSMYGGMLRVSLDGYIKGFERVPREIAHVKRVGKLLPGVNAALAAAGMPFVRETPFGTLWTGSRGGALFFWHGVKSLELQLPKEYSALTLYRADGTTRRMQPSQQLKNIPQESILVFTK